MDLLKAKETDKDLDMLYSIDDAGVPKPLTIQQREALAKRFQRFPVIRYRLGFGYTSVINGVKHIKSFVSLFSF